jgi:twitching motility protein PilT
MSEWITKIRIDDILASIAKNDAISDIHISANEYISFRKNGDIVKYTKLPKVNEEQMETIARQLMKWNMKAYEKFVADREADLSYIASDWTPYRVNMFFKLGKMGTVLRKINAVAMKIEDLMLPDIAQSIRDNVLSQRQWLFLVTWPTGSGKSTSLVAMIDELNHTRPDHIITIEDPIEFIFTPDKAIITQREIGHDSWSFANALRPAMREDPDIVLVWEIRDRATAEAALNLAETWHMVFSTLHTQSASGTVNRYISFFPPEIQDSIADRLADSLIWVMSQRLVKRTDGKWRVWVYEIMINTPAVRNNIKRRQLQQIDNIIETGSKQWMILLKQYAKRLVNEWLTTEDYVSWILNSNG